MKSDANENPTETHVLFGLPYFLFSDFAAPTVSKQSKDAPNGNSAFKQIPIYFRKTILKPVIKNGGENQ